MNGFNISIVNIRLIFSMFMKNYMSYDDLLNHNLLFLKLSVT